jgi:hypothetical protein
VAGRWRGYSGWSRRRVCKRVVAGGAARELEVGRCRRCGRARDRQGDVECHARRVTRGTPAAAIGRE